ncbi:MAG: alpha/beta hydrolase [Gemmataceae bacterium]
MFTEHSLPAAGVRLNVAHGLRAGAGSVWFFHGLGRRWEDFSPLLGSLAALHTIRAVDHRGHGKSSHAPGCYSVAEYAADAAALVKEAGEPVSLVGHSLGALAALGAAAAAPACVRGVVLLDPPGPGYLARIDTTLYAITWAAMQRLAGSAQNPSAVARELAELRIPTGHGKETARFGDLRDMASLRFMAHCLHDLDPDTLTLPLAARWLGNYDPFEAARQVKCPALLLASDPAKGGMLPPAEAEALAAALPDGHRVDLTGIGHLIHWQDASRTLQLLHGFLSSLR